MFVNVAGELSPGGSTLTQQLVRNQFLDRRKKWARKFNEIGLALLIEARYSKGAILEAHLNDVYLGQHGAQSVHGVGAAAEFYFGRDSKRWRRTMALLVGMIQEAVAVRPATFAGECAAKRRNWCCARCRRPGCPAPSRPRA
ncbi:MAG: transglycosylase domain-containing protein [Xanthomonadales bacterium]|nr:transglycosylase domain-containing protein [Xanthomonadales bacterium]